MGSVSPVPAEVRATLAADIQAYGCLCQMNQLKGAEQRACQTDPSDPLTAGWCYVDPLTLDPASATYQRDLAGEKGIVNSCGANEQRTIRFVPSDLVKSPTDLLITCVGGGSSRDRPSDG